jgi:pilus assembly protein CpaE
MSEEVLYIPRISVQAFCETNDLSSLMQQVIADRRTEKMKLRLQMGGIEAALEIYRDNPTPNLILIESDNKRGNLPEHLTELSQYCDESTKVIVVGRTNDIMLYRKLIELGVSDYLIFPITVNDLVKTIARVYTPAGGKPLGRVLAITGAKGGVGASTLAHNLGCHYSRELARSTCLVDFDFAYGTLGLNFNQDILQGTGEALQTDRLDAAFLDKLMLKHTDTLSLFGSSSSLERSYDYTADQGEGFMDAIRNASPNIILDVPAQWSALTKKVIVQADDILVIAEPDLTSLRNIKNMFDMLKTLRPTDKPPRYILNNVGVPKRPEIKLNDFARAVEDEPLAIIPHDPALFGTAANNGQMLYEVDAAHSIVASLIQTAQVIAQQKEIKKAVEKQAFPDLLKDKWSKLRKKA